MDVLLQRNHVAPKSIQFTFDVTDTALNFANVALQGLQNLVNQFIADVSHGPMILSRLPR
jgi:hypothetical protein